MKAAGRSVAGGDGQARADVPPVPPARRDTRGSATPPTSATPTSASAVFVVIGASARVSGATTLAVATA